MPDAERALVNTEQEIARMTGARGDAASTTQVQYLAPELSGLRPRANIERPIGGFTGSRGLRDILLEMRANLTTSILESRDRLRHVEAALAALDASPELDEALSRALNW